MYYIDDYKKRAVNKIIPYLIEFPQIVKIVENSASRYQAIEDVIWNIANNFRVDDARGIFLDALAHNEVVDIVYTDKADDAFTYGTDKPLFQAYGTGHYYNQGSYISGLRKDISEDKMIRAIKAKIIQNNTNGTVEDLIESLKLYFNAQNVKIYESHPLNLSVMLSGKNLEVSSSGNYETIKKMLPACVNLNNIYLDSYNFDLFTYDNNSSYGESRYPILVGDTVDKYFYISQSISLESGFKEWVQTNHNRFEDGMYCCIAGELLKSENNSVLLSSGDTNDEHLSVCISTDDTDGFDYISLNYNGIIYPTNIEAKEDTRYTIILYNINNTLNLWAFNNIQITGNSLDKDNAFLTNLVSNTEPNIQIPNFTTIDAPVVINCLTENNNKTNFCDFVYYAILFGKSIDENKGITEYYATCYGEKQILFNCLENKNHLNINTLNPLNSNIMYKQSYYNYKANHSNGKYVYFDSKSSVRYYLAYENNDCEITDFNISFDVCCPIFVSNGVIINNFIGYDNSSYISFNENNGLRISFKSKKINENQEEVIETLTFNTENNIISPDEYCRFEIKMQNSLLEVYKNSKLMSSFVLDSNPINMPQLLRIGKNSENNFYKGFLRNIIININGINDDLSYNRNITLPYINKLSDKDNIYEYINEGARLITTPQLISDTTSTDLYGNNLISKRQ